MSQQIKILKLGYQNLSAIKIEEDRLHVLLDDLGLNGDRAKIKDDLAKGFSKS